jgi:short subunit dehydrogenase-like uncharacterized protein
MTAGPIAVYGATGYTGRLVAHELRRRDAELVLSGRSAGKLHALAEQLGGAVHVRPAPIDDRAALRHALGDCAVVANCAGPFVHLGEPVVRAAVETGTHYLDTTGEQAFIRLVLERFDDAARAAEVALVPAMGFDYAPGDLACALAAGGRGPFRDVIVAYAVDGFTATRGTLRSALEVLASEDVVYEHGEWHPAPRRRPRASFAFPEPIGRRPVTRYPGGEVLTVPRHLRTAKVTELITLATLAPHPRLAGLVPFLMPLLARAPGSPLRTLIDAAIDRLPEGPSEAGRRRAVFTVVAVAVDEDGVARRVVLRGHDVYATTATCIAEGAVRMAAAAYDRRGALAPAQAFEPASFLAAVGVTVER